MVVPGVSAIHLGLLTPGASDVALRALVPAAAPTRLLPVEVVSTWLIRLCAEVF